LEGPSSGGPTYRAPLGLPPGSVRAALALVIAGLFWGLLLFSEKSDQIPLYLYFLLCLELVFFVAHGASIGREATGQPNPWGLPRGFFRVLLIAGFLASVGYRFAQNPEQLVQRLTPAPEQLRHWPYLLLALSGGFGVGRLLRLGPWRTTPAFQDVLAWVSLIAMMALGVEILIVAFVRPNLEKPLDLSVWEYILTGVVACYFGSRS
jgi:hypothetical protein